MKTATDTFREAIHPITAVTSGIGRWLDQKFDNKVEVEKMLLADGLRRAVEKIEGDSRRIAASQNLATLSELVDGVSTVTEELVREMWVNLLSRELIAESVHPEFIAILKRLSRADANLLIKIAEQSDKVKRWISTSRILKLKTAKNYASAAVYGQFIGFMGTAPDLNEIVLENLNLIEIEEGHKYLTRFGEKFLEAVRDFPTKESLHAEG